MEVVVKVTRRGQTTIPIELRRKFRIREGTHLVVEERGDSIVMHPVPSLEDLAGSMAKISNRKEANAILDEMEEDKE